MKKVGKFVSYTDQVYREVKGAVISQDIVPGETLQERQIADTLGVSRTPVREALKRLEFEGWVETIPWKGVVVKEIERQDILEVFQCRYANEGYVAKLIAPTIEDAHIQDLNRIDQRMREAAAVVNRQEFINEDRNFHMYLAQLTNNERLIQFLDHLSDQLLRLGIRAVAEEARMDEALEEHKAIIQALKAKAPETAAQAVEAHIQNTEKVVMNLIDEEDWEWA
ncbi:GntR family transcriptional regulator [Salsuginibacillus halophilus]|uniref:GntR family transcriptional regulator n=1 Tax=Salsuginibacillus halophilus TaxID=517424 RepID=A0A2P8HQT8_9BACI|nr:GntR family transcriptional regulator [Salsuginibacillus halophilus]PSL48593.1 GntR family transcriptional regulator [Salsuginibacillus halophilus]